MVRVLFLITEFDRGGAERALYDIVSRLDRERFAPQVACLGGPGYYTERYSALGIPVHHLGLRAPRGLRLAPFALACAGAVLRLSRLLVRERIRVLQTFLFHANLLGRAAALLARTPVVLGGVRTAEPRHSHTLLDGLTFWLVSGEVCVSEAVRRFQAGRAGLPPGKLFVIPNGVCEADFPVPAAPFGLGAEQSLALRGRARAELGLPPAAPVFAFAGRLCEAKAIPDLLRAFLRVARHDLEAVLAIAGDGPLAPEVRRRIARPDLEGRVVLTGWLDDPRALYAAADCLVLSSKTEGMPGAVLEAMASGLPVVATDAPGCEELVLDGQTGFLVGRGRPRELAARMRDVLEDPPRAARMGLAGRARALGAFSLPRLVRRYEALYERLLRTREARRAGARRNGTTSRRTGS